MDTYQNQTGMMSNIDIVHAIEKGEIKIYPYKTKNLTGLGYNISPTEFILSIKKGTLEKVHTYMQQRYVYIEPNDTVLAITKEYIEVNASIAGMFHSKVSRVCQGLGHVSTTLDPLWKGQLIISINNPTSKKIKLVLSDSGCLCTLLFFRLQNPVQRINGLPTHDNDNGRASLLLEYISQPSKLTHKFFHKSYMSLKTYIENELVPSLNGKISGKNERINALEECKTKISNILKELTEDTLNIGPNGKLYVDLDCINAIKGITLLNLDKRVDMSSFWDFNINIKDKTTSGMLKEKLNYLVDALVYEIEQEQQSLRIQEQNESITKLAKKNRWLRFGSWLKLNIAGWLLTVCAILVIAFCIYATNSVDQAPFWTFFRNAGSIVLPIAIGLLLARMDLFIRRRANP